MVVLYLALLLVLALVQVVLRWRVARLEKRYARVAAEADGLLKQVSLRPGNSSRPDPLVTARQQFDLAVMAVRRDRVEERYSSWQSFAERFAAFRGPARGLPGPAPALRRRPARPGVRRARPRRASASA